MVSAVVLKDVINGVWSDLKAITMKLQLRRMCFRFLQRPSLEVVCPSIQTTYCALLTFQRQQELDKFMTLFVQSAVWYNGECSGSMRFVTTQVQFLVSVVNPLYPKIVLGRRARSWPSRSRYKNCASKQFLLYVFTQASVDIQGQTQVFFIMLL